MKKASLLFALILTSVLGKSQNFAIGHLTASTTDASRSRNISMEIYYPADVAGNNVAFTQQPITAPILVFGHGFVMTWDAYANIWQSLVPHGYLIAFATTETGFSPSHLDFGKDLAYMVTYLQSESNNPASTFYQRLDSAACVMGHSMGGGSSFLAVQYNTSIQSMVTFAAAETTPSAITAAAAITIPSLVVAGSNDCVAPPAAHQLPMYNALTGSCKTYISITGGSHCQMAESNTLCSFGEATCLPVAAISRSTQHTIIDRYLIPWLDYHFRNDCIAGAQFDNTIATDPDITFQKTCTLCSNTGTANHDHLNSLVEIFPNPVSTSLYVNLNREESSSEITLMVTDLQGRMVMQFNYISIEKVLELNTSTLPTGAYYLHTVQSGHRIASVPFSIIR